MRFLRLVVLYIFLTLFSASWLYGEEAPTIRGGRLPHSTSDSTTTATNIATDSLSLATDSSASANIATDSPSLENDTTATTAESTVATATDSTATAAESTAETNIESPTTREQKRAVRLGTPYNSEEEVGNVHSDVAMVVSAPVEKNARQVKRDSIRAKKRVWLSALGGPSYTPEASLGIGGALLASFKINRSDTLSPRSFVPAGFNVSINKTIVLAGAGTLFFKENRFRIYVNYGIRFEDANFYGIGIDEVDHYSNLIKHDTAYSSSMATYRRQYISFNPRLIYNLGHNLYVGGIFNIHNNKVVEAKENSILKEKMNSGEIDSDKKYHDIGLGAIFQYDTRDDIATPTKGLFASASATFFGHYIGSNYNYAIFELEYRQFQNLFHRRSTLAWTAKSQLSAGNVPFTELPTFGSANDLRGYLIGKYRDKSMAYGIIEYRHMFGSYEAYERGTFWSKCGFVIWGGTGTVGRSPRYWNEWKWNYGAGLRIQIQPGKNLRIDLGKGPHQTIGFYLNMTEAF